jgi:mersacidin/lichenicidin family type 2 lantibiotic
MKIDKIKAWKDEEYRSTLTAEQLAVVNSPVASLELSEEQMSQVNGGTAVTFNMVPPDRLGGGWQQLSFSDCCQEQ